jgi:uncharacterized protein
MKQLPEKIALDKAVNGQRHYQGSVKLHKMSRLADMLTDIDGDVEFSLQFDRAAKLLGKAQVKVKADLPLICVISHNKFMLPVEIDTTVGFIDDLEYEEFVGVDMEPSWVEGGFIKPLEIIEDELILAVPDAPFNENETDGETTDAANLVTDEKPNPFDILKSLK